MSPILEAQLSTLTLDMEIPVVRAVREGKMISIESAEEFRKHTAECIQVWRSSPTCRRTSRPR